MTMLQRSRMLGRSGSAALAASATPGASAATLPRLRVAPRRTAARAAAALHTSAPSRLRASLRRSAPPDADTTAPMQSEILSAPKPFFQQFKTRLPIPLPSHVGEAEFFRVTDGKKILGRGKARGVRDPSATPPTADELRDLELDRRFFLPSRPRENLSILRACLTTGLVDRATKLFQQLQAEEDARSKETEHDRVASGHHFLLDEPLYNLMLGAFLRKAWATKSNRDNEWLRRAWAMFEEMSESTPESRILRPRPGHSTLAIMLKGVVR
jgi:hypothetical protein